MSIKRSSMIKSSETFSELFSKIPAKQMFSRDFLLLRFKYASSNQSNAKIGIVVGKRSFKRAVDRNLLKRRIRASIFQNQHLISGLPPVEFLIIYKGKNIKSFHDIDTTISKLFLALAHRLNSNL